MQMPRSTEWKPCTALRPRDFLHCALWGFDLSRESDGVGDETWVRPYAFGRAPASSDVLFVRAGIWPQGRRRRSGLLTFRFVDGLPAMDGIALFTPSYRLASAGESSMDESEARELLARSDVRSLFPLRYEAAVPVGRKRLALSGTLVLEREG